MGNQMKERIEEEIVRIKEEAEQKKKEELVARRNEIRRLLQGHSVSISSLKLKCEKETWEARHEENSMAIPEGDEDEDEEESDDENDTDNDQDEHYDNDSHDDSLQKTSTSSVSNDSLKTSNPEDSDSEDDSDSIDDTENGNQLLERKLERRPRRTVFHRMKSRFVVRRKSQSIRGF